MSLPVTPQIRRAFIADAHYPNYHFAPPANWMNDPNGFIQWQGRFHVFYQHNPNGVLWGDMHWGHAVSDDLMHWTDLPIALRPTPGGPDEAGVFSGCAVDQGGTPTLIYTGAAGQHHEVQTQCVAVSHDGLQTWEKYAANPVVSEVPAESGQSADFRDPFVWKEDGAWFMAVGSHVKDVGGTVFLYRSADLLQWDYLNPLLVGDQTVDKRNWECPNFFRLGDQWVLIVSAHTTPQPGVVLYFVGDYHNHRFTPHTRGVLDYGHLYAPLTTLDYQGRRLLIGWIREGRPQTDQRAAGWSGVHSIARVLSLDVQNRLITQPVPELGSIRGRRYRYDALDLNGEIPLDVSGLSLDLTAEFDAQPDSVCGIAVACSDNGAERTDIVYEAASGRLTVCTTAPDAEHTHLLPLREAPHALDSGEALSLRILVDGSVVEVIANGRTSVTHRMYPSQPDSTGVRVQGMNARLKALDVWEMESIWR